VLSDDRILKERRAETKLAYATTVLEIYSFVILATAASEFVSLKVDKTFRDVASVPVMLARFVFCYWMPSIWSSWRRVWFPVLAAGMCVQAFVATNTMIRIGLVILGGVGLFLFPYTRTITLKKSPSCSMLLVGRLVVVAHVGFFVYLWEIFPLDLESIELQITFGGLLLAGLFGPTKDVIVALFACITMSIVLLLKLMTTEVKCLQPLWWKVACLLALEIALFFPFPKPDAFSNPFFGVLCNRANTLKKLILNPVQGFDE